MGNVVLPPSVPTVFGGFLASGTCRKSPEVTCTSPYPNDSKARWLFIEHLLCPGSEVVLNIFSVSHE